MNGTARANLTSASTRRQIGNLSAADKRETAQYISEMTLELRNLAKVHSMISLQGLLEVAYYEAFMFATRVDIPEGEIEHLRELSRAAG